MPAPIRKDTLAPCDAPSMLYDTIRRPNAPSIPPKPIVEQINLGKDTIETTQQRLNREVMERFQNTSSRLPHQSFMVVVQAGKYLFLAVMLPTYICFYGIPHWFFMNALPQLFITIKAETQRVGKFFSEMSVRIVDMMKGLLQQMLGDALRMLNQQSKNLLGYLLQPFSILAKKIKHLGQAAQNALHNMQQKLQGIKENVVQKGEQVLKKMELLKDAAIQLAEKAAYLLLYPIDLGDRFVIKPCTTVLIKVAGAAAKMTKQVAAAALGQLQRFSKPIIWAIKKTVAAVYHPVQQATQYLLQQTLIWLQPKLEAAREIVERYKEKLSNSLHKLASSARNKIKETVSTLLDAANTSLQLPMQLIVQFVGWAWWQTTQMARTPQHFLRKGAAAGKRTFQFISRVFSGGVKGFKRQGQWLAKAAWSGLAWLLRLVKVVLYWVLKQLINLPRKALKATIWLLKAAVRAIRSVFYGLRVAMAWGWVLSSCGMILVRELSQEISSWYRSAR